MPSSESPSRLRQRLTWIIAAVVLLGAVVAWRMSGRDAPAAQYQTAAVDRGPVDRRSESEQAGDTGHHLVPVRPSTSQRSYELDAVRWQAALRQGNQSRMRTDFKERTKAVAMEHREPVRKAHGLSEVPAPVVCIGSAAW